MPMGNITVPVLWGWILAGASAFILFSNVAEKLAKAWRTTKAPNEEQDRRISALESRMKHAEECLDNDNKRFRNLEEGNRVMILAQLALLDHGLDGNNVKQMEDAKKGINVYLANK